MLVPYPQQTSSWLVSNLPAVKERASLIINNQGLLEGYTEYIYHIYRSAYVKTLSYYKENRDKGRAWRTVPSHHWLPE